MSIDERAATLLSTIPGDGPARSEAIHRRKPRIPSSARGCWVHCIHWQWASAGCLSKLLVIRPQRSMKRGRFLVSRLRFARLGELAKDRDWAESSCCYLLSHCSVFFSSLQHISSFAGHSTLLSPCLLSISPVSFHVLSSLLVNDLLLSVVLALLCLP
nr:hypothetical protein CFP56_04366 [Quercus suber]